MMLRGTHCIFGLRFLREGKDCLAVFRGLIKEKKDRYRLLCALEGLFDFHRRLHSLRLWPTRNPKESQSCLAILSLPT